MTGSYLLKSGPLQTCIIIQALKATVLNHQGASGCAPSPENFVIIGLKGALCLHSTPEFGGKRLVSCKMWIFGHLGGRGGIRLFQPIQGGKGPVLICVHVSGGHWAPFYKQLQQLSNWTHTSRPWLTIITENTGSWKIRSSRQGVLKCMNTSSKQLCLHSHRPLLQLAQSALPLCYWRSIGAKSGCHRPTSFLVHIKWTLGAITTACSDSGQHQSKF